MVEIIRQHLLPPRPIMIDIIAPNIHPVWDSFGIEDLLDFTAICQHVILPGALSAADNYLTRPILVEVPWIVQVG